jgi:hypothetical protein
VTSGKPQTKHGTYVMYLYGCRCGPCARNQAERNARNRADRLASGRLTHGTRSAYDAGCRCDPCRQSRREAYNRLEKPPASEVAS